MVNFSRVVYSGRSPSWGKMPAHQPVYNAYPRENDASPLLRTIAAADGSSTMEYSHQVLYRVLNTRKRYKDNDINKVTFQFIMAGNADGLGIIRLCIT